MLVWTSFSPEHGSLRYTHDREDAYGPGHTPYVSRHQAGWGMLCGHAWLAHGLEKSSRPTAYTFTFGSMYPPL